MSLCVLICLGAYLRFYLSNDDQTIEHMGNSDSHRVHHTQPLHVCIPDAVG